MLFSWSLLLSYFQIVVLVGVEMETVFWPDQDQLRVAGTGLVLHTEEGLLEGGCWRGGSRPITSGYCTARACPGSSGVAGITLRNIL